MADFPPSELGDYALIEVLHETEDTLTFVAKQRTIDRTVALVLLKPHRCADPAAVATFQEDVKAKARVTHPRIAAVFESSEQDGHVFYTREMVAGQDIVSLRAQGNRYEMTMVWDLLKAVCDSFLYYEKNQLGYRAFQAEGLVLIHEEPYLANLATSNLTEASVFGDSLVAIRESFWRLFRAEDTHLPDVRQFFARMDPNHKHVFKDWQELLRACNVAAQVTSTETPEVQTGPALKAASGLAQVETKEMRELSLAATQAKSRLLGVLIMLLLALAVGIGWWWLHSRQPLTPAANPMVNIPGGGFVFGKGETRELDDFVLSQYEITIAQYAKFLAELKGTSVYNHVNQPKQKKGHQPKDWSNFYAAALARGIYKGQAIDINCPIVGVDWWDAYAYARWRGGRLPTEEEWERAARGIKGFDFPWGADPDPIKSNTGGDYDPNPGAGGEDDGFSAWGSVDQLGDDISPEGLIGMGGNVSEWTATLEADPNEPGAVTAVVKGASFMTKEIVDLTHRSMHSLSKASMSRGFRIAADAVR